MAFISERERSFLLGILLSLCVTALFSTIGPSQETVVSPKKTSFPHILYLNSYHQGFYWSDEILRGLKEQIERAPFPILLQVEFLDTKRYPKQAIDAWWKSFREAKYPKKKYDLVIVSDDNAYQFLLKHQKEWFPGIPILFCGVNDFNPAQLEGRPEITGIVQSPDLKANLALGPRFHPSMKKVAIITDNTTTGIDYRNEFEKLFPNRWGLEPIWLDGRELTLNELVEKVKKLPEDSFVLYAEWFVDKTGTAFLRRDTIRALASASRVPIYSMDERPIGLGAIGGKVEEGYPLGLEIGRIGIEILQGAPVDRFPVHTGGVSHYLFDYHQLRRWGISEQALPAGSRIVNLPESFYFHYRNEIWIGTFFFCLLQSFFIIAILLGNRRRRRIQAALKKTKDRYRHIFENSPLGIWRVQNNQIRDINLEGAKMFGADSIEDALREAPRFSKFFCSTEDYCRFVRQFYLNGLVFDFKVLARSHKREPFWCSLFVRYVESPEGTYAEVCSIDIDQQEKFLRRFEKLNDLRAEVVSTTRFEKKLEKIVQTAVDLLGMDQASVWLMRQGESCRLQCFFHPEEPDNRLCNGELNRITSFEVTRIEGASHQETLAKPEPILRSPCRIGCFNYDAGANRLVSLIGEAPSIPFEYLKLVEAFNEECLFIEDLGVDGRIADRQWVEQNKFVSFAAFQILDQNQKKAGAITVFSKKRLQKQTLLLLHTLTEICSHVVIGDYAKSELIQARERAEEANRSKSLFLANMSHEIRTPLTSIIGFADLMEGSADPDEQKEALATIRRNGRHLLELINEILDLSRIEADRLELEIVDFDPRELVHDVFSTISVRAESKGLRIAYEIDNRVPKSIQNDPTRVRQILYNLLGNAIKFTEKGTVSLRLEPAAKEAEPAIQNLIFEVRDTGIGISSKQLERLFAPFTQADMTTTRRFGGTGLGLTISRKLARLMGGDITLESTVGEGSVFRLLLPVKATTAEEAIEPEVETRPTPSAAPPPKKIKERSFSEYIQTQILKGAHILLAEDGLDNQRLIRLLLEKVGARVTLVENGKDAFDQAMKAYREQKPFDVILMDMQMPIMDGYTSTERLRQADYPHPIIALTASVLKKEFQRSFEAGCNGFLAKPIIPPKLIATVAEYVRARSTSSDDEPRS